MAKIDLAHLLDIEDVNKYKFHASVWNGQTHPLDAYVKDGKKAGEAGSDWWYWQAWYKYPRWEDAKYILSFMQVYTEGTNVWLFGGIFEIKGLNIPPGKEKEEGDFYDVNLTEKGQQWIGRLKITIPYEDTRKYPDLSKVYSDIKFREILKEPYWCSATKN